MFKKYKPILWSIFVILLALLVSCSIAPDIQKEQELDMRDENLDGNDVNKKFSFWSSLEGKALSITVGNTSDAGAEDRNTKTFFLAEVTQVEEDYLVVTPHANISLKNTELVSCSSELLKHSESYIIPRALMKDSRYLTDEDAAAGDLVRISFNPQQVYKDTVYGETPVMKIVFYFTPLSENDIIAAQ
ncbi:MAG: hypothetical protein IJW40_05055 [Clostridia bacterium]|nr:hypothetical protein [Clostridia bacterium]